MLDILRELGDFGIEALAHDPLAEPAEFQHEYGIAISKLSESGAQVRIFERKHSRLPPRYPPAPPPNQVRDS